MAAAEDAASVLEQFVHDVANLPAEIAHLLEEVHAKDLIIQECRQVIYQRDNALQRHVRQHGCLVKHPKEDQFIKAVEASYDKAQALQAEKCALADKAALLLDRHVRRLDVKIRDLQNDGAVNVDPQMPSLLRDSPSNLVAPISAVSAGVNAPLLSSSVPAGGSATIGNAAMARMVNHNSIGNPRAAHALAPVAGPHPHPALQSSAVTQRQREMSASAVSEGKRRRIAGPSLGALPSSGLAGGRQSSLGPGTPRIATPGSRAGSAGPRTKKLSKKIAPHQQQSMRKKVAKGAMSKKAGRRHGGTKASPSTTDNESAVSEGSGSDEEVSIPGNDGAADDYEEDGDEALYCTCQTVSHGDMVACDNENCELEWFHWECVGLKEEPKGKWLCPNCRQLDKTQIKMSR